MSGAHALAKVTYLNDTETKIIFSNKIIALQENI